MRSDSALSGRVQLNTDLSASALSGHVPQSNQTPANWWGYCMPPEPSAFNTGLPQVFDTTGKAPMPSAGSPIVQVPQYTTATTMQPTLGGFQVPLGQTSNSSPSANLLPMQQKAPIVSQPGVQVIPQVGYNYPAMPTNYQPSANFVPMNANNNWSG
jgi:hypothetical protein